MTTPDNTHIGEVNGIKYSVDLSVIEKLKSLHGIDAISEIEAALMKEETNDSQSTKG